MASKRLEEVKQALDRLFSDTSRPASETLEDLLSIRDEVETLIECIEEDGEG